MTVATNRNSIQFEKQQKGTPSRFDLVKVLSYYFNPGTGRELMRPAAGHRRQPNGRSLLQKLKLFQSRTSAARSNRLQRFIGHHRRASNPLGAIFASLPTPWVNRFHSVDRGRLKNGAGFWLSKGNKPNPSTAPSSSVYPRLPKGSFSS